MSKSFPFQQSHSQHPSNSKSSSQASQDLYCLPLNFNPASSSSPNISSKKSAPPSPSKTFQSTFPSNPVPATYSMMSSYGVGPAHGQYSNHSNNPSHYSNLISSPPAVGLERVSSHTSLGTLGTVTSTIGTTNLVSGVAAKHPDLPALITTREVKETVASYNTLLNAAKKYREALLLVSEAAADFGEALEGSARCKGAGSSAEPLLNAGGLHYLVSNHQQILAKTIQRSFEQPVRKQVQQLCKATAQNEDQFLSVLKAKTKALRAHEADNIKLSKRRVRNLAAYRSSLLELTSQIDDIDRLKYEHFVQQFDLAQTTSLNILSYAAAVVRAEVEIYEGIAKKGWSGGGLDDLISSGLDPFGPSEDEDENNEEQVDLYPSTSNNNNNNNSIKHGFLASVSQFGNNSGNQKFASAFQNVTSFGSPKDKGKRKTEPKKVDCNEDKSKDLDDDDNDNNNHNHNNDTTLNSGSVGSNEHTSSQSPFHSYCSLSNPSPPSFNYLNTYSSNNNNAGSTSGVGVDGTRSSSSGSGGLLAAQNNNNNNNSNNNSTDIPPAFMSPWYSSSTTGLDGTNATSSLSGINKLSQQQQHQNQQSFLSNHNSGSDGSSSFGSSALNTTTTTFHASNPGVAVSSPSITGFSSVHSYSSPSIGGLLNATASATAPNTATITSPSNITTSTFVSTNTTTTTPATTALTPINLTTSNITNTAAATIAPVNKSVHVKQSNGKGLFSLLPPTSILPKHGTIGLGLGEEEEDDEEDDYENGQRRSGSGRNRRRTLSVDFGRDDSMSSLGNDSIDYGEENEEPNNHVESDEPVESNKPAESNESNESDDDDDYAEKKNKNQKEHFESSLLHASKNDKADNNEQDGHAEESQEEDDNRSVVTSTIKDFVSSDTKDDQNNKENENDENNNYKDSNEKEDNENEKSAKPFAKSITDSSMTDNANIDTIITADIINTTNTADTTDTTNVANSASTADTAATESEPEDILLGYSGWKSVQSLSQNSTPIAATAGATSSSASSTSKAQSSSEL